MTCPIIIVVWTPHSYKYVPAAVNVTGGKSTPAADPVTIAPVPVVVNRAAPFIDVLLQSVVHGTIEWATAASSFVHMIVSPT